MAAAQKTAMLYPLQQYISETTVHGPPHFVGNRKIYVRLLWAAAFVVSFGFCCLRISDAINKFTNKEASTTVKENAVDFEFPDVYICNETPVSGSYSVQLGDEETAVLTYYRKLANDAFASMAFNDTSEILLDNYAVRLVNSLPFQFLSENLGQQPRSIIFDCLQGECDTNGAVVFYHPSYLNCFSLNITSSDLVALQNPSNSIKIFLFLDPLLSSIVKAGPAADNRTYYSETIDLKPVDWDFNTGTDFARPSGFRIFLTAKGHHPSHFDTQVFAGPAMHHRVQIRMQDTLYNEADFDGQCSGDNEATAEFLNPFSGEKLTFKYNQAVCWYREVAKRSQDEFNCSLVRQPIPWEFRSQPSCFNITAMGRVDLPSNALYRPAAELMNAARNACDNKVPCKSRSYSYQYSSSGWPTKRVWQDFVKTMIKQLDVDDVHPGIQYLVNNGTFADVKESMLQVELSALSRKSQEVQLSLAYSFNSLIADVGGLLGLFLGMSLLSVLELVELLHNWTLLACDRRRRRRGIVEGSQTAVGASEVAMKSGGAVTVKN